MVPCSPRKVVQTLHPVQTCPLHSNSSSQERKYSSPLPVLISLTLLTQNKIDNRCGSILGPSGIYSVLSDRQAHTESGQGQQEPLAGHHGMGPLGLAPSNLKVTFLVIEELDVSLNL